MAGPGMGNEREQLGEVHGAAQSGLDSLLVRNRALRITAASRASLIEGMEEEIARMEEEIARLIGENRRLAVKLLGYEKKGRGL